MAIKVQNTTVIDDSRNFLNTARVGVNTDSVSDSDLVGVGNSMQGIYISNGMVIVDNALNGNHYIGTNFNGIMAGPVNINGVVTVDGNFVVV
jgi:hypothetical protein